MPDTTRMDLKKAFTDHRKAIAALLIFFCAFTIRVQYNKNTVIDTPIRVDARKYALYGHNLASKGVYSQEYSEDPKPDNQVTPGFPLFLAANFKMMGGVEKGIKSALFLHTVLGAATAVLVYLMGMMFLPFGAALAAGFLTAFSPHLVSAGSYLLTETLFTFLLAAGLTVLFVSIKRSRISLVFAASILLGSANLVRPSLLLYPTLLLVLMLFIWKSDKKYIAAGVLVAGLVLTWAPWSLWSHTAVAPDPDRPSLAPSSFALGTYPDLIHKSQRLQGFPYIEDREKFDHMATGLLAGISVLRERAAQDPLKYLRWYAFGKPAMFWSWDILAGAKDVYIYPVTQSYYKTSDLAGLSHALMKITHGPIVLIALAGFFMIMVRVFKTRMQDDSLLLPLMIFSLILYFTAVHTVLAPLPRYSIPLRPYLYLACLFSLKMMWDSRDRLTFLKRKS